MNYINELHYSYNKSVSDRYIQCAKAIIVLFVRSTYDCRASGVAFHRKLTKQWYLTHKEQRKHCKSVIFNTINY